MPTLLLLCTLFCFGQASQPTLTVEQYHRRMLYPCVRVKVQAPEGQSSGSGEIIYSKPDDKGNYRTYVLTNHHVVEAAIHVTEEWNSSVGRKVGMEKFDPVRIENFHYVNWSVPDGAGEGFDASIVAYNKELDVALLKVDSVRAFPYVAQLFERAKLKELHVFDKVILVGCTLGEPPMHTSGEINAVNKKIRVEGDWKLVWQVSANALPGASGGACYRVPDMKMIGLMAYRVQTSEFMSFIVPAFRIYEWLEQEALCFIYDPAKTPEDFIKARQVRRAATTRFVAD